MSTFETKLVAREEVAERTMAFHFARPAGFDFAAGQAIDLELPGAQAGEAAGLRHAFSLVSAPFQRELTIATRMRDSDFKRALGSLPIGAGVTIDGPFGTLCLHEDRAVPAVLIAGGIGITPFVSMLRQAANDRLPQRLILIYSNRRPEDAAFLSELRELERQNPNFRLHATMTQPGKSRLPWTGETGPIGEELIRRAVGDLSAPIYYVVGPPALVEALQATLQFAGVAPERIATEEFYGYG
jgi:ferredoxin-NADP reductase